MNFRTMSQMRLAISLLGNTYDSYNAVENILMDSNQYVYSCTYAMRYTKLSVITKMQYFIISAIFLSNIFRTSGR